MVGVRHGLARRLLGPGDRGRSIAVAGVVRGVAVAAVAGFDETREHICQQGAKRDDAGADDAEIDLDDAVVSHGRAVPGCVQGQGGLFDGEDAGYRHGAGARKSRLDQLRVRLRWTDTKYPGIKKIDDLRESESKQDRQNDPHLPRQLQGPSCRNRHCDHSEVGNDADRRREGPYQQTSQAGVLQRGIQQRHGQASERVQYD